MNRHTFRGIAAHALLVLVGLLAWASPARAQYVEYIHTDALGTPVTVTDQARKVIEHHQYEPFGKLLNEPVTDGPAFTGHVADAATGLDYMQQRYYDPGIGRFLSVDPVTPSSYAGSNFNRYRYAADNPYSRVDPDGRYTCEASICAAIAGYVSRMRDSQDKLKHGSADWRRVHKALGQIGHAGGPGPRYVSGELCGNCMAHTDQQGTTTVDIQKIDASADPAVEGARSLGHEAQHDIDAKGGIANTEATVRATETNAYDTEGSVAKGLGLNLSPQAKAQGVEGSVQNWLKRQEPPPQEVPPQADQQSANIK